MLAIEEKLCPIINITKPTTSVLNEDGEEIDKPIPVDRDAKTSCDFMSSISSDSGTSSRQNKKQKQMKIKAEDADLQLFKSINQMFADHKLQKEKDQEARMLEIEISRINAEANAALIRSLIANKK